MGIFVFFLLPSAHSQDRDKEELLHQLLDSAIPKTKKGPRRPIH
jgi:hypothetical protein